MKGFGDDPRSSVATEGDGLLKDVANALYVLFFATHAAAERLDTLTAAVTTAEEREALKIIHIGLINFDPAPPEIIERLRVLEGLPPVDASALGAAEKP